MLGPVLRRLIKDRGLTLEEVGSQVGVTQEALSQYLNEKRLPQPEILKSLAAFLDTTYGEIFTLYAHDGLKRMCDRMDADFTDTVRGIAELTTGSGNIAKSLKRCRRRGRL